MTAALLLAALAASWLAAGCGGETATSASSSPNARATSTAPPVNEDQGPPKSSGGVCERATADRKSLPSWARITVERFMAAVDRGDRSTMRDLLDPSAAGEVLADLRAVTRLRLLELEDRY